MTPDNQRILNYLASPFVLAAPIALIVILFLPDTFNKYELRLSGSGRADKENSIEKYHDLNNDGFDERVITFNNSLNKPAIKVLTNSGNNLDQWNLDGNYPIRSHQSYCCDLNNDGYSEIFAYTVIDDSLFLNAIQPYPDKEVLFRKKLISLLQTPEDLIDIAVNWENAIDLDNDGTKELIFGVKAGHSKQPRGIFIFNQKTNTINRTKPFGANIGNIIITDLNNDNEFEIYCSCATLGNIHDSLGIPFHDYSSWLLGFNTDLEFLFPPIEYQIYPSTASMITISSKNDKYLVASFQNTSDSIHPSRLIIIDQNGIIIKEKKTWIDDRITLIHGYSERPDFLAYLSGKGYVLINSNLEIVTGFHYDNYGHIVLSDDLDMDGNTEFLFSGRSGEYKITRNDLSSPVDLQVDFNPFTKIPLNISVKHNSIDHPEIFIKAENKTFFYQYHANSLYYLKYPIWLGIYGLIFLIIFLIQQIQKTQIRRKMEIENQLNALQLKTIKSQMDPHFTFNALTGISTHIKSGNSDVAYDYTMKFSRLLRSLYSNTDMLAISLTDEIEFVNNYLEVEKLRFGNELDFQIEFDKNSLPDVKIPRMLIQLFVENAIKHGIRPKEGLGNISVHLEKDKEKTIITIEDNGVGRTKARQLSAVSGKGLKIINEMITLFRKITGRIISYKYIDLYSENGKATGTRVIIKL